MGQGPLAGLHEQNLVDLTGAHRTTVRRWRRRLQVPRWLERLVRICCHGELAEVDPAWRGWSLRRGELVSPEGWTFTPGAVRAGPLWKSRAIQLGVLERGARQLIEADPVNRAGVEKLRALELALQSARHAMDDITHWLPADERNRIFRAAPARRLTAVASSADIDPSRATRPTPLSATATAVSPAARCPGTARSAAVRTQR